MKAKLLFPSLICVTSSFAQQTVPLQTINSDEIKFEETAHSFGVLKKGADCTCNFKFKNTGSKPIIIINAQTSCGCDVATFPKEPILPGQTGIIKYHYDSNRIGAFQKSMTVSSNAKNANVTLMACGRIVDPIYPDPYNVKSGTDCNCGQKKYSSTENAVQKKMDSTSVISPYIIRIYPNPFSTQTTVESSENLAGATLTIYNLAGQQVKEIKNISGQIVILQRDNFPSGLYFICITQDNKAIATKKIIITD